MRIWHRIALVVLLSWVGWQPVMAALPTVELLKRNLTDLGERSLPESEQQAVQLALEQSLAWLEQAQQARQQQQALAQQLSDAAQQIRQNRQTLAQDLQQAERRQLPAQAILAELEGLVVEQTQQLNLLQKELSEANALVVRTQTRPERAQIEISTNQKRLQEINTQLKAAKEGGKPLLPAERLDALHAELEALQERNKLRQAELAGNSTLQDLASSNRELLATKVQIQEDYIVALQGLLNERRQAASELTVQEQSLEVERAGEDTLLLKESNLNLKLSDYLLTITERRNVLAKRSVQIRQQLDSVQQVDQALDEQISVLQGSLLLAKILYQQKQALPQLTYDRNLAEQIADTRLYQFELRQFRETLQRPEDYVEQALRDVDEDGLELRAALTELIRARSGLLERLNHELNAYLSEAIAVQLNQKQLQTLAVQLRTMLDEQMFWVPSNKPLDRDWLKALPKQLGKQLNGLNARVGLTELASVWRGHWLGFLPALILSLLVLWKRRAMYQQIQHAHRNVGHYLHDRQLYTPMAVMTLVVLVLPVTAWFASAGWLAQLYSEGVAYEFGVALVSMAKLGLVFSVAYRLLVVDGVAQVHCGWPVAQVTFLRRRLALVAIIVWLLALVVPLAQANLSGLSDDVLGIALLMLGLLSLSALLGSTVWRNYGGENLPWFARMLGSLMALLPLALSGALVMGYYYTVLQLSERLLVSLALVVVWAVLRALLERGLTIAARRLAWRRVEAARESAQDSDSNEAASERHVDIIQVNEQSLRLLRLLLLIAFVMVLYWVWADVISLFAYLDNVALYESSLTDSLNGPVAAVSLRDMLDALIIIGMTIMLARNLPGLMEVLFLSRFNLAQGTAYAMMRLLSYSISSMGIVMTLAALGVSWGKLQWLVAALSVGLGFGLQEIFANFISGLIILFERPVRIGDVVTIGELSGTVSRIRIRATTITDFDRKEIIVPNKAFVTERLVNWSLTDTVTRMTVNIGLAYDADLDLARKLMLQTMEENQRIMTDPEPVVLFLGVTPSTFNHELRYYVRELSDRNPSVDEVLSQLVARFREHDIEMAFKQVDVYLRNNQGQDGFWSSGLSSNPLEEKPNAPRNDV